MADWTNQKSHSNLAFRHGFFSHANPVNRTAKNLHGFWGHIMDSINAISDRMKLSENNSLSRHPEIEPILNKLTAALGVNKNLLQQAAVSSSEAVMSSLKWLKEALPRVVSFHIVKDPFLMQLLENFQKAAESVNALDFKEAKVQTEQQQPRSFGMR